jgi:hypothetical protein
MSDVGVAYVVSDQAHPPHHVAEAPGHSSHGDVEVLAARLELADAAHYLDALLEFGCQAPADVLAMTADECYACGIVDTAVRRDIMTAMVQAIHPDTLQLSSIEGVLGQLGLERYTDALTAFGVETAADVLQMVDDDWESLGVVVKPLHKRMIVEESNRLITRRSNQ